MACKFLGSRERPTLQYRLGLPGWEHPSRVLPTPADAETQVARGRRGLPVPGAELGPLTPGTEEIPEQNRRQLEESLSALRGNRAASASMELVTGDDADDFITMELVTGEDGSKV